MLKRIESKMRLFHLLCFSLIVVSCSSEKRTEVKTENCSLNGQPINCSELRERRQDSVEEPQELSLTLEMDAAIEVDGSRVKVLENAELSDRADAFGQTLFCGMRLNVDQSILLSSLNDNTMVIRNLQNTGDRLEFKRMSGSGFLGTWENVKKETNRLSIKRTLTLTQEKLQIKITCTLK